MAEAKSISVHLQKKCSSFRIGHDELSMLIKEGAGATEQEESIKEQNYINIVLFDS